MRIVTNDNFTPSAINSRRESVEAWLRSHRRKSNKRSDHDRNFSSKVKGRIMAVVLHMNRGHRRCIFFLSLSLAINQRLTASSIRHKEKGVAEIRSNVGISPPWPIFLEAIHFRLQNTRIYMYIRFRLARYEVGDAEGTKFRVTINIGMEVRSISMFHQI